MLFPDGAGDGLGAEALIEALEAYEGDAVYSRTSLALMNDLLIASDSLCGTVDWENGTCDFTDGMFKRVLELCNRYASKGEDGTNVLSGTLQSGLYPYANIYGNEEEMAARGMTAVWCLFDDTCHAGMEASTRMAVSSASANKEGAWEFIRFLISEEEQSRISWAKNDYIYPSSKIAFDTLSVREIAEGGVIVYETLADGSTRARDRMGQFRDNMNQNDYIKRYTLTKEKVERVRKMLEEVRAFPLRTEPIRTIIDEEAAAYFSGDRSADEVCANIQNRVQLYLSEHQ